MAADSGSAWPALSIEDANRKLAEPGTPLAVSEGVIDGISMKYYPEAPPTIRFLAEARQRMKTVEPEDAGKQANRKNDKRKS